MQRRALLTLPLVACSPWPGLCHAQNDPQSILAASDAIRTPAYAFGVINTLTEYRQGKQTDACQLAVLSRPDPANGQFHSLVRYLAPARDAGKLILYSGKALWFYDPSSQGSIRLSPQQRLLGQASNGDVVTAHFARDYRATHASADTTPDGDRQPRQAQQLTLEAHTDDAHYPRIAMWVDAVSHQPIKARFYAPSGALLKTAYYRRYQAVLGVERPTETVIIDGQDPTWVTVMRYSQWQQRDVPESWLRRESLPLLRLSSTL